ncbi:MAG TPA: ArsB/NhaD family transporter [Candidatus Bathyarchaeia archaeon]
MSINAALSIAIFLATLFLMIKQPKGINLGMAAGLGALASIVLGTVTVADAVDAFYDIWDAALAFVGIVTLSVTLEVMGFFKWTALRVARLARGDGVRLYLYIGLLAAAVSILFSNDSAVLILTPIVLEMVKQLNIDEHGRMAYLFAAGLIADTAAMPLITSNPVNIVSADYFGYTFIEHLVFMGPVAVATIALSMLVVYLFFRGRIPRSFSPSLIDTLIVDGAVITPVQLRLSVATLIAVDILYVVSSLNRVPVSFVICGGALLLLIIYLWTDRRRFALKEERRGLPYIARRINWDILAFMLGIFLVVQGLRHAGAVTLFSGLFAWCLGLPGLLKVLAPSIIVTISASAMNNWPMTMLGLLSVEDAMVTLGLNAAESTTLIFSNIIGNNLGPHFFPIGSLAILMWLNTMKAKGLVISLRDYLRVGSVLSILEVVTASIILWVEVELLGFTLALAP